MPLPEYDVVPVGDLTPADPASLHLVESMLPDVEKALARVRRRGEYLRAWDGEKIKGVRYTSLKENDLGWQNHFQGIMRLRCGPYAVVSGGDCHETMAHLFVVKLATRKERGLGPWGTNCPFGDPLAEDTIALAIGIDADMWHAGGMDFLGDILAVPVERSNPKRSRVVFFDMHDGEHPKRIDLSQEIVRDGIKAGAVALTKLPSGRFLCAVWSQQLDFYVSSTTSFADGFCGTPTTWNKSQVRTTGAVDRTFESYQTINFIRQSDGALYLAGTRNTGLAASHASGTDVLHLFHVDITEDSSPQGIAAPVITKVAAHSYESRHSQGNMDGGAGVYVSEDGRLLVYSAFHFRLGPGRSRQLRLTEFRPHAEEVTPHVRTVKRGWVELFEDPYFEGRFFSIRGERDSWITDYKQLLVQSCRRGFAKKVSSVRFQLPSGSRYVLFAKEDFKKPIVALVGTGRLEEIPDFNEVLKGNSIVNVARQTTSSRYEFLHPDGSWRKDRTG